METAYRLTWNPRRPENSDDIEWIKREGNVAHWRCGNARILRGCRIFLLRLGKEPKGIVGVGTAIDDAEKRDDPAVKINFYILQDEPYISLQDLGQAPYNQVAWANQSLAVRIPATVSRALDEYLLARASSTNVKGTDDAEAAGMAESLVSGAGFGDPERNRMVETAAVSKVTAHYRKQGWRVLDVSSEKRGYDLECIKGRVTQHVEVKGVTGDRQAVMLTENERHQAKEDRAFVLAVVTSALSEPNLHMYSAEDMFSQFEITPMIHRAVLRGQDDGQRQGKLGRGR